MGADDRLRAALAAIDAANADDPHQIRVRGALRPKEQAHAELASEWVERLCPDASEALRLAARAHHVRRWAIPRADHPEGRAGYLRWRRALQDLHARTAADILRDHGYDDATVKRVDDLLHKRGLGRGDPEVQAFEDALCLVFLETQLRDIAERLAEDKLDDVVRKTLRKMSPQAIRLAGALPLDPRDAALLRRIAEAAPVEDAGSAREPDAG